MRARRFINRRTFLTQVVGLASAAIVKSRSAGALPGVSGEARVRVALEPARTLAVIPPDFLGLGYEIASVAGPGLLSDQNSVYVQLVRTLGAHGVIRVGGNTSDFASYSATGQPRSRPEGKAGSVVNDAVLRELGTFLDATGWTLIWGLNLGNGTLQNAIDEAKAVTGLTKSHLLAFEIGNEPDLFPRLGGHRRAGYGYGDYLREYRTYRDAVRKAVPNIAFAGPDAANATEWVTRFAADERSDIKLLTHHYYREDQNLTSTLDKLLHPDPKLAPMLARLRAASESCGVAYRICEANSFSGGGKPGISDSLGAALWVLDFMFMLASAGCAGVNMETGVNQRGFISSYSPIGEDGKGHYWATPEYYGVLAFAQAGRGRIIGTTIDAGNRNLTAYATQPTKDSTVLVLINKEPSSDAVVVIDTGASPPFPSRSLVRLSGPSLESKVGVILGDVSVSPTGSWKPTLPEQVNPSDRMPQVRVPAASAAIVTLQA